MNGIEVDFLPVGEESRSADTIAIRYGDLLSGDRSKQTVVVVDGGTKESGADLVEHIKTYYNTDVVDLVIMTHPDKDHCGGLTEIIENFTVGELWMHQPWGHSEDIRHRFSDGRITDRSLERQIRYNLDAAHEVEKIALKKGIKITEPFSGTTSMDGVITVVGPNLNYYQSLLPDFRSTPDTLAEKATSIFSKALQKVVELLDISTENLPGGETSAENDSSAVVLFQIAGYKVLITGDAGVNGLKNANYYASLLGISLDDLDLMQVPHHGSKRNVSSEILDAIKGKNAFISASKNGAPKHPSQRVINALVRRGTSVAVTRGRKIRFHRNAPSRNGWTTIKPMEFITNYEE